MQPRKIRGSDKGNGILRTAHESAEWVEWVCPFCEERLEDPPTIKATSCSKGHIVYLGKVHEGPGGGRRRAYKSRTERRREEGKERSAHEAYVEMLKTVFPKKPASLK